MQSNRLLSGLLLLILPAMLSAQRFIEPSYGFSEKKISYITMADGTEIECNLKKIKFEKGLIEELKVFNLEGDKIKIKPEEIKHMYLPPSGLSKLAKVDDFMSDATLWDEDKLDGDLIGFGYVYFEQSKVKISKKKTEVLILQLLNPHFSNKIKVYDDPFSKETASVGVGGFKVAGGLAKSYYVKRADVAVKLKKKEYKEEFPMYFKSCKAVLNKYKKDIDWSDFVTHIYTYATDCE